MIFSWTSECMNHGSGFHFSFEDKYEFYCAWDLYEWWELSCTCNWNTFCIGTPKLEFGGNHAFSVEGGYAPLKHPWVLLQVLCTVYPTMMLVHTGKVGVVSLKDSFLVYNWVVGMLIQTSMLFPIILQESVVEYIK